MCVCVESRDLYTRFIMLRRVFETLAGAVCGDVMFAYKRWESSSSSLASYIPRRSPYVDIWNYLRFK